MVAAAKGTELTRSTEDYLKVIFQLQDVSGAAQTSAIAEALAAAPPWVTGMVKRLSESGPLEHTPYRGVQLTASGTQAALRVLRRHRGTLGGSLAHGHDTALEQLGDREGPHPELDLAGFHFR